MYIPAGRLPLTVHCKTEQKAGEKSERQMLDCGKPQWLWLGGPRRHMLEAVALGDDDNAVIGDGEAALAIEVEVVADLHAGRHFDAFVDNRPANLGVAADIDSFEEDRIFDMRIAVNADEWPEDTPLDEPARDNRAGADDAIHGPAGAVALAAAAEDELRRRQIGLKGADGPDFVVEVEQRIDGDEVHVGFVIGIERADVAPIGVVAFTVFIAEWEGEDLALFDQRGDDVAAKVVPAARSRGVFAQLFEQKAGGKDVNAHRAEAVVRIARDRFGARDFFFKADDPLIGVHLHDAELAGRNGIGPESTDGDIGADVDVVLHHRLVVHLVDVVAGEDDDVFRPLLFEDVNVLIDGVSGTLIPGFVDSLLRWDDIDEFAQFAIEIVPPTLIDVAIKAHCLVLREEQDAAKVAVEAVGKREVDNAVQAAERDGRFGPVAGERLEACPFAARQDDRQHVLHDASQSEPRF